jgi:murein L,D-transpeptidase YafK
MIKKIPIGIVIFAFLFLLYPIEASLSILPGNEKIPDSIVSLSSGYIIVVDKQFQKIYVFHKNGSFAKVFEAPCSTGKNPGSKQVAGDAKTPNGIFFVTKSLSNPGPPEIYGSMAFPLDYPTISDKPGPPEVYGSMAFPLDYPTIADKRAGRDGNNIWIHGTTKTLLPTQSKGCVVLHDGDLKRLANFIYFNKTPVVISESLKWVPQSYASPTKNELLRILTSWNKAFIEKDIRTIDSLYLQGSEIKGKRREDLNNKVKYLNNFNKHFALQPRDISILQEHNNAVIIFDQIFAINNNSFQGFYNKLILEKINNKWYVVDDTTAPAVANKQLAQVNNKQKEIKSVPKEDIRNLVKKWATSWQAGNMKTYRRCYASNFHSKEMDLDAWVSHKADVRQKSKNINIRIDNLQISANGNIATAEFTQNYSSSILSSKSRKKLELRKISGEWKIYREII